MFDVGFTELLLIGVVALVVIGPERLPAVARTVGQYVGKLQRFVTGVKRDIRNELESGELKELLGDQKQQIDELRKMVNTTRKDLESGTREVVGDARKTFAAMESSATSGGAKATGGAGEGSRVSTPTLAEGADASGGDAPVSLDKPSADAAPPAGSADAALARGAAAAAATTPAAMSTTDRVPAASAASDSDAH